MTEDFKLYHAEECNCYDCRAGTSLKEDKVSEKPYAPIHPCVTCGKESDVNRLGRWYCNKHFVPYY